VGVYTHIALNAQNSQPQTDFSKLTTKEKYEKYGMEERIPTWEGLKVTEEVEYMRSKHGQRYLSTENAAENAAEIALNRVLDDVWATEDSEEKEKIQREAEKASTQAEIKTKQDAADEEDRWVLEARKQVVIYVDIMRKFHGEFMKDGLDDNPEKPPSRFIKKNGDLKKWVLIHMSRQIVSEFSVMMCVGVYVCIFTYTHTCIYTHIHTHIHTYIHTHIHTYVRTYIR